MNASRSFRAFRPRQCSYAARPTPTINHLAPPRSQALRSSSTAASAAPEQTANPTQAQTHYTFFPISLQAGPPPKGPFKIDVNELKREFLQLQARAHPDRHPQADKKRAEALSARINEAYKTLQNPLLRAQYLLSLRGIDVAEDETAKVEDPELLMEVLEARERIEDAQEEEDLEGLRQINDGRIKESVDTLEQAFDTDELGVAKSEAVKLRYWINIKESIDNWEPGKPVVLQH